MKIGVNLDSVGKPLEKIITEKLETAGFPKYIGKMILPILKTEVIIDDSNYGLMKISSDVNLEDRINPEKIITQTNTTGYSLTTESLNKINKIKEARAQEYVEKISDCLKCDHTEICYQLTTNYLMSISLLMKGE